MVKTEFEPFGGRAFLGFDPLTHIPLQKKMIQVDLLTDQELAWVNDYHRKVLERVTPYLKTDKARTWLRTVTTPLLRA